MTRSPILAVAACAVLLLAGVALAGDPAADAAQGYAVEATASPEAVKVGDAGKVAIVIRPKAPTWHVHPEAPLKVRFAAPAGLKIDRAELGRRDVADAKSEAPRFETAFVATAPGAQETRATVDFFICSDNACVKQVRTVPVTVTVK